MERSGFEITATKKGGRNMNPLRLADKNPVRGEAGRSVRHENGHCPNRKNPLHAVPPPLRETMKEFARSLRVTIQELLDANNLAVSSGGLLGLSEAIEIIKLRRSPKKVE